MTHTSPQQPEALRLAEWIESDMSCDGDADIVAELRSQHARIAELEAQLSAIGAGGVEPLRKQAEDGWIQDGHLLYRLTDGHRPRNRDEINVTMANSSRTKEARTRRASELLHAIRAAAAHPENIREGAPYDNPEFEQLARDMGVWGTPQAALCAQFWLAATQAEVPQGWKLVPVEPTEKMISEGCCAQTLKDGHRYIGECAAKTAWSFMLAAAPTPPAQGMYAANEWEDIRTLPTCDDLIWLYCQDSNTIDGPIAPEPNLEEYGWSHWAYANAPSTAWIDTAQTKNEGEKK